MQKILPWTLLTVLLTCVIGCGVRQNPDGRPPFSENQNIGVKKVLIEEKSYDVYGTYYRERSGLEFFLLVVCPEANQSENHGRGFGTGVDYRGKKPEAAGKFSFMTKDQKIDISVALDSIHFVDDGKIIWSKTAAELGIKLSDVTSEEIIRPILENLIREHVQPQEGEREGQE
jgi:hypothetical protein